MTVDAQIKAYIAAQPEPKRQDMQALHHLLQTLVPKGKLWFVDGKDEHGKVVSNPSIGYGQRTIRYANGTTKPFYQAGISANGSGISVYVMGIADRKYLPDTFGKRIGKATLTGYCIKFKVLSDINVDVLKTAIREGIKRAGQT